MRGLVHLVTQLLPRIAAFCGKLPKLLQHVKEFLSYLTGTVRSLEMLSGYVKKYGKKLIAFVKQLFGHKETEHKPEPQPPAPVTPEPGGLRAPTVRQINVVAEGKSAKEVLTKEYDRYVYILIHLTGLYEKLSALLEQYEEVSVTTGLQGRISEHHQICLMSETRSVPSPEFIASADFVALMDSRWVGTADVWDDFVEQLTQLFLEPEHPRLPVAKPTLATIKTITEAEARYTDKNLARYQKIIGKGGRRDRVTELTRTFLCRFEKKTLLYV